ncbi:MAG: hypothetical protein U9P44_00080 [archaeon]|nr:hypothetical protein [archaeon]
MKKVKALPEQKLAAMWFLATFLIFAGVWVAVNVEWVLGVTTASYYSSLFLAFAFNLLAGLIYINIIGEVAKDL